MIRRINNEEKDYLYSVIKEKFDQNYKDNIYTNWYVYELDNKIIAFINYDIIYDKSELEYIYVDEIYRNKGYATKLLNIMILDLKDKGVNDITLEVREDNIKAIKFYKKNGFKDVSIRKNYYGNIDAILMMRSW